MIKQNLTGTFSSRQNCLAAGFLLSVIFLILGPGAEAQAGVHELLSSISVNMQSKKTIPLALSQVDQLLKLAPDNANANKLKAVLLAYMDEYEEALPYIERAQKLDPANSKIWSRKAEILHHLKQDKEALVCVEKAEQIEGKRLPNPTKADVFIGLNRLADAEKEMDWLVDSNPQSGTLRGHRIELSMHTDHWEKAANDLTILIHSTTKHNQSKAILYAKRADCYVHQKQYTRAIADYQSALTLNPDDRQIHSALMKIYDLTGDTRRASLQKKFLQTLDTDLRLYK